MGEQWILDLTKELQLPDTQLNSNLYKKSIYRVPKIFTDINASAFMPECASFGPYHHGRHHLRPMEQYKHLALMQFLRRIAKASKTPEDVFIAMKKVEPRLLASYDSLDIEDDHEDCSERGHFRRHDWLKEKDEFLKLMIVDGCFALEVMLAEKRSTAGEQSEDDSSHDPVFGSQENFLIYKLWQDMLLLENQLPLLALTTLAEISGSGVEDVCTLILGFYWEGKPMPGYLQEVECWHLLHVFRCLLTLNSGEYQRNDEANIRSATELRNAGVSFCMSGSESFKNISFKDGVLSLPKIELDPFYEAELLNLIAFEHLHDLKDKTVTSFAIFMDNLIDTVDDVALLRTKGIICGIRGSDEYITKLFNRITKGIPLANIEHVDSGVDFELNKYCEKRMHRWRASFVDLYLTNPWAFTSLLGGLLLLALTICQTVYTILQYYDA